MPSPRRVKVFGILVFLAVVTFLLWSASLRQRRVVDLRTAGDFYSKTLDALGQQHDASHSTAEAEVEDSEEVSRAMSERLKEAAQVAKDKANKKAPKPDNPSDLVGVGNAAEGHREEKGVAGRKKYQPAVGPQEPVEEEEDDMDHEARAELSSIIKKSPSKSFRLSCSPAYRDRANWVFLNSHHLLEIVLPALSAC